MKRERSFVENRRKSILETVNNNPEVRVDQLAELFNVSPITIRRDLQFLEDRKKIVRFYGGATANKSEEQALDEINIYRTLIAKYTATLIEDKDILFMNTSSNALQVLEYVEAQNVTVITNNRKAIHAKLQPGVNIILTGGEVRYPKASMVGDYAVRNIQAIHPKKCIIGCKSISYRNGIASSLFNEANINALMLEQTIGSRYIIADHSKVGAVSNFRNCGVESITDLITDELAPEDELEAIRRRGVKVHVVRKKDFDLDFGM